jgi:hypothetical protein
MQDGGRFLAAGLEFGVAEMTKGAFHVPSLLFGTQGILLGIVAVAGYDMQVSTVFLCNLVCSFHVFFMTPGYGIHAAKQYDSALGLGGFGDYVSESLHCASS